MDSEIDTYAKIIWDYMLMHQELKPMDAIFALGSNDVRVAERAAELYLQGYGKYIICSGGNGKASQFTRPEAEVFSEIVISKGVPKEKVLLEPRASNTGENVLFTRSLLKELNLDLKSFVLVQKPYMERRTYATFRKQWPEADCVVTSPQVSFENYSNDKEKEEQFKRTFTDVMVGDLERIKKYPAMGFQIPQDIPDEVWYAYEKLVELGFTKYAIK